jgi:hypothetical protein
VSDFRPLLPRETGAISRLVDKGIIGPAFTSAPHTVAYYVDLEVRYQRQPGGFCICVIHRPPAPVLLRPGSGSWFWYGVSRRSYKDRHNPIRGEMLAFVRAAQSKPVNM